MIIVNIMGGLGNQMNQYAIARKLSSLLGVDFRLDLLTSNSYQKDFIHTYQLANFNIKENLATSKELSKFIKKGKIVYKFLNQIKRSLRLKVNRNNIYKPNCYLEALPPIYREEVLSLPDDTYLHGYFASFKYFDDIRENLLAEFSLKQPLSEPSSDALSQIQSTNSVSVHFRRGDFLTNKDVKKQVEGINTDKYYENAIDYAIKNVENPHFFIFSDEIEYLKENLKLDYPVTYMDFNPPQRGFEDLHLMSQCKTNICAGLSSFSYWAAYLNNHPDKLVITPKTPFNDEFYTYPHVELESK